MAKRRIMQTTLHDGPGNLVFYSEDLGTTRLESPPTEAPNTDGVG